MALRGKMRTYLDWNLSKFIWPSYNLSLIILWDLLSGKMFWHVNITYIYVASAHRMQNWLLLNVTYGKSFTCSKWTYDLRLSSSITRVESIPSNRCPWKVGKNLQKYSWMTSIFVKLQDEVESPMMERCCENG